MNKIIDSKVVSFESLELLSEAVNDLLKKGYVLFGFPSATPRSLSLGILFSQSLVKYERTDKKELEVEEYKIIYADFLMTYSEQGWHSYGIPFKHGIFQAVVKYKEPDKTN